LPESAFEMWAPDLPPGQAIYYTVAVQTSEDGSREPQIRSAWAWLQGPEGELQCWVWQPTTGNRLVDPNSRRRGRPSSPSPRRFPVWKTLVAALSIAFGLVPQGGSPWKAPTPPPARAAAAAVRSAPSATLAAAPTPADGAACLSFSVAAPCQVPQPAPAAAVVALPTPRPVAVAGPPLVARPAPPARVVWATCWRIVQGRRLTYGCWWNLDTQAPA
jgi:hypothetical protein